MSSVFRCQSAAKNPGRVLLNQSSESSHTPTSPLLLSSTNPDHMRHFNGDGWNNSATTTILRHNFPLPIPLTASTSPSSPPNYHSSFFSPITTQLRPSHPTILAKSWSLLDILLPPRLTSHLKGVASSAMPSNLPTPPSLPGGGDSNNPTTPYGKFKYWAALWASMFF